MDAHRDVAAEAPGPWHEGERAIQRELGVAERMADIGPLVIRTTLPEQHRLFYRQLPFVILGTVDRGGRPWATIRSGPPGFLWSPDPGRLTLSLKRDVRDPADAGMEDGDGIALLGIDLHTRRRNRLNGVVHREAVDRFDMEARQAFGNCPRSIHPRSMVAAGDLAAPPSVAAIRLPRLSRAAAELVAAADTVFVSSYVRDRDERVLADVSHRGGEAGFVRRDADGGLTIPDYSGNRFFNTLGNLLVNPRAGLVFVDFKTGDLLQMTGRTEVILSNPEPWDFPEAERIWRFRPDEIVLRPAALRSAA